MWGKPGGGDGGIIVAVYAEPPPRLLALLRRHTPHSLPLLRRLEFTRFPGGITEHARVLWASGAALPESEAEAEAEADSDVVFAAGYLDLSRSKRFFFPLFFSPFVTRYPNWNQSPLKPIQPTFFHDVLLLLSSTSYLFIPPPPPRPPPKKRKTTLDQRSEPRTLFFRGSGHTTN